MVGHWQPEMSPATQHGAGSPVATTDLCLGGLVTRNRPTTGSLSLFYPELGEGTSEREQECLPLWYCRKRRHMLRRKMSLSLLKDLEKCFRQKHSLFAFKKKSGRLEKTRFLFSASHLLLTPQHQGKIIISCQESRRSGSSPSLF